MTPKFKRRALTAWLNQFPDLARVGSTEIGRFVGPFYQGITLERDSSNEHYYPTFHITQFMLVPDSKSLLMCLRLQSERGVAFRVTIDRYEVDLPDIFDEFREQIPLPLEGNLHSDLVVEKLMTYRTNPYQSEEYDQYFIAMTVYGWLGDSASQKRLWKDIRSRIDQESPTFKQVFRERGKDILFEKASRTTRQELEEINRKAIEQHKLQKLKHFELLTGSESFQLDC